MNATEKIPAKQGHVHQNTHELMLIRSPNEEEDEGGVRRISTCNCIRS